MTTRYLIAILLSGASVPALAQEASAPPPAADEQGLDDIVVTASRRAENLQNVATNISALTSDGLAASSITNSVELQGKVPGLVFSTNGNSGQPYIRGVGSDIISPGGDAPVAVYIDGAYQARTTAAVSEFFDIERVEVLKGPQGALYGRNATGGAMNIISKAPGEDFSFDGRLSYGNYDRRQLQGAVNIPLGEKAALRFAGNYIKSDGYTRNLTLGNRIGGDDSYALRASLRLAPTDNFTFSVVGEYTRDKGSKHGDQKLIVEPGLPAPAIDLAPVFGYTAPTIPSDPRVVRNDTLSQVHSRTYRLNAKAEWDAGFATLQSITGYTDVATNGGFDLDGTEVPFSYNREEGRSKSFTQSLQLASDPASRLRWIVGADYFRESASQNFDGRLFGFLFPAGTTPIGPDSPVTGIIWDPDMKSRGWSVFADLQYDLTDELRLVASGRYSEERKRATFRRTYLDPLGVLLGGAAQLPIGTEIPGLGTVTDDVAGSIFFSSTPRVHFNRFTPRVALEYRPRKDLLLYASATNGFKSGGLNLLNNGEPFEPEKIWSYEVGTKASWFDRKLRTNLSAFHYDYKDLQVIRFDGLSNNVANADAEIYGAELEIEAQASDNLTFDGSLSYLHAEYTDYLTIDSNNPGAGIVNIAGNRMPKAPKFTLIGGATYSVPIGNGAEVSFRGEARYASKVYFDQFETPALSQSGYTLVNARLTYTAENDRYSVSVFGRNLFNKDYRQAMVRVDSFFGTLANYGPPRTYGVEVGFKF